MWLQIVLPKIQVRVAHGAEKIPSGINTRAQRQNQVKGPEAQDYTLINQTENKFS